MSSRRQAPVSVIVTTVRLAWAPALTMLLFGVIAFAVVVPSVRQAMVERKREGLRHVVQLASHLIASFEESQVYGRLAEADAKAAALSRLRELRYGADGRNYFWVTDLDTRMLMHPYRPDLEGRELTDFTDTAGRHPFRDFVEVARRHGSGFVPYAWQYFDDPTVMAEKISYVEKSPRWGWVVGSGMYVDDVERDVLRLTRTLQLAGAATALLMALLLGLSVRRSLIEHRVRQQATRDRELLEAQLRQAQKMDALGTLVGGVAHDFNNILAAILGYTELALVSDPAHTRSHLEKISEATERARQLVRQILTFSRRVEQEYEPLALKPIVDEALTMLRSMLPATVALDRQLNDCGVVLADATQIHQVLINLCTNAHQALEEKSDGLIRVQLGSATDPVGVARRHPELAQKQLVQLTVEDNGKGMDEATLARIFDPFFTTKPIGKGTGLGLSVVHGIVAAHGGCVEVRSTPAVGTTFDVFLPITDEPPATKTLEAPTLQRGTERLLLVDDEIALLHSTERLLSILGYRVTAFSDPATALETFRQNPQGFDLIVTDQRMPGLTGSQLLDAARTIRASIASVLVTGSITDANTHDAAQRFGVDELLIKPVTTAQLAAAIRRVLDRRSVSRGC